MTADSAQFHRVSSDLHSHWGDAYTITSHPGQAEPRHAKRLDDGTLVAAGTPWALPEKIIGDYSARLVPGMANGEGRPDAC